MTEERPRIRVYAHIFWGKGIEKYARRYAEGRETNATPYSFHLAEEENFSVAFSSDRIGGLGELARRVVKRLVKLDLLHAYFNRRKIEGADIVWTMTEDESLAIAVLMRLGLVRRRPIISSSVWIVNEWNSVPRFRRWLVRRLSPDIAVMTVQSKQCLSLGRSIFPKSRVELMHFGINTDTFRSAGVAAPPDEAGPMIVFSAGNDRTRDWETALGAFGGDPRFELRIWCQWLDESSIEDMNNVKLFRNLSSEEFLREFETSTFCLVSMKENIFSGITFALISAALGRPLICTRTGGVPTYFDDREVFYVPIGDHVAMREAAASSTRENREAKAAAAKDRLVESDYTARGMVRRYVEYSREIVASRGAAT